MRFTMAVPCAPRSAVLALGLVLVSSQALGGTSGSGPAAPILCNGAIQHPIQVSVRALDPVRRGATVRLEVRTKAAIDLATAEVRLVSAGGAGVVGARRVPMGRLSARGESQAEFQLAVPAQGHRFLAQFEVRGEGPNGRVSRGAAFNLLPDGPADQGRRVTGASGQPIMEYTAKRIGQ